MSGKTSVLRAVSSAAVPFVATALALRTLFPTPAAAAGTRAEWLARVAEDHTVAVAVALFVVAAAVVRYWVSWLLPADAESVAPRPRRSGLSAWGMVVVGALAALVVRAAVGAYRVEGASMLPTLEPLDVVGGSRIGHGLSLLARSAARLPARGDLVVFGKPAGSDGPDLVVKRVVGLPGDRISMRGSVPVLNDRPVRSCEAGPYLYPLSDGGGVAGRVFVEFLGDHPHLAMYTPGAPTWGGTYEVKPGEVFVIGDNRSNSNDSRAWDSGRGSGLPLRSIEARLGRWLFGVGRDERVDLDHLLRPLELSARLSGLDTSYLRDGIRNCLEHPPTEESPGPRPRNLWPDRRADRWFRSADGRPIVLDEPPRPPAPPRQ